jgi:SAM-dependent methyltransferase
MADPFGREHAEVYEATYRNRGKDWAAEARDVADRIRRLCPRAQSLLDVGCGTGAHLETFQTDFARVEGLDRSSAMLDLAARRLSGVRLHEADMREFALRREFDAVTCLCAAMGFLESADDLRAAARCIATHLKRGGVVAVEPWWLPERFVDGYVGSDLVRDGGRVLARVSHTRRVGQTAHMEVRWLVGEPDGLLEFGFTDILTLFTREQYQQAFAAVGCDLEYEGGWLTGRGLFVGVRR